MSSAEWCAPQARELGPWASAAQLQRGLEGARAQREAKLKQQGAAKKDGTKIFKCLCVAVSLRAVK